jgi:ubiquinone/menaquinone biosynthesis C-methylase UbiE
MTRRVTVLSSWLAHPATRGLDLDDPRIARARVDIIRSKPLLREVYREWYDELAAAIPAGPGRVLELGSGAGFLSDRIPHLITSDVVPISGVHLVASGTALPFGDGALKAAVMTDVLHHIPAPRQLFRELARVSSAGASWR